MSQEGQQRIVGRLRRFPTQRFYLLVEVAGPLQRNVAFGSDAGNASFESGDVVNNLLTVKSTQHDLEGRG